MEVDVWRIAQEADLVNSTEVPSEECPGQRFKSPLSHFVGTIFSVGQICWKFFVDSSQLMLLKLNAILLTFVTLNWLGWVENPLWDSSQNIYWGWVVGTPHCTNSQCSGWSAVSNALSPDILDFKLVGLGWSCMWLGERPLRQSVSDVRRRDLGSPISNLQTTHQNLLTWSGQSTRRKKLGAF